MKPTTRSFFHPSLCCLALAFSVTAHAGSPSVPSKEPAPKASTGKDFKPLIDSSEPWQFTLALPGWLANTSGTFGLHGKSAETYLSAKTLIQNLDMIATFSAEARKGRFGIYGDFLYVSASDGVATDGLLSKVDARLDQYLVDLEINYRLLEGPRGFLDLRAGVRYTNLFNKVSLTPNGDEIDRASAQLVDDVSSRIRETIKEQLSDLDLFNRAKSIASERAGDLVARRLLGLGRDRAKLSPFPLGNRHPGLIRKLIAEALRNRAEEIATAVKAQAAATTPALRAAAQKRLNQIKESIAKRVSERVQDGLDTESSVTEYWFDPYVGINARLNLGKSFYLTAKADIGGFGIGSKLTWQASGALGYQLTKDIFVEAGYRYLYTDYDNDGFLYKVTQSGAQITTGIAF